MNMIGTEEFREMFNEMEMLKSPAMLMFECLKSQTLTTEYKKAVANVVLAYYSGKPIPFYLLDSAAEKQLFAKRKYADCQNGWDNITFRSNFEFDNAAKKQLFAKI